MASSPVHSSGQAAILKRARDALTQREPAATGAWKRKKEEGDGGALGTNTVALLKDVFDYDFTRERIFLEIAEAEIAAMRKAEEEEKAAASERDDSDDELARQSAKLSLSSSMSSTGHADGTPTKPRSTSEEDVAAAISASLRERTPTAPSWVTVGYAALLGSAWDAANLCMWPVMGKAEGQGTNWHGHVTAVTVAPEFRRLGLAKKLMDYLENVSVELYDGYFVDLFVRVSNSLAIGMYEKFGYSVYRRVLGYYSSADDGEDAFGTAVIGADGGRWGDG
ncbi:unnamed protein product [Phytophthora fragariaefolia]|uniref:Unnamed protein product n=1 Tax=Phytophthora fragariaefolia TaxID=1490495 RepID=A0A9W7CU57_9STRA|nr:unnamed protein product [Phytophthora fragariaefolia]